jgi:predicted dehydrogenase
LSKGKLKVAIVGLGKMGLVHAGILSVIPEVQLVGLCEKSAMTRRLLAKVFRGIPIVSNLHKLAELDIDAVYVTTPIPSHFPIVRTILDEGLSRNLFVEKTLAASYEQAKEICRLADTLSDTNMVGYLRRSYVTFRKAKDLLMQDVLGEIRHFSAHAFSSDFSSSTTGPSTQVSRGGVLRDLG